MSAGNDGHHEFMADKMRHAQHDAASLRDGLVENFDGLIQLDFVDDGCVPETAMENRQLTGIQPSDATEIAARGPRRDAVAKPQAHVFLNPPTERRDGPGRRDQAAHA
ncbi:hypothetical protein [Bradyrhizobium sp.]|uniref:hypothetical protein n=1 Tax=Bradyrhizobium sp. TaxID=376 RepID=UPI0025C45034|nr:hypothetical protein [Bradyrhizobium sp.]